MKRVKRFVFLLGLLAIAFWIGHSLSVPDNALPDDRPVAATEGTEDNPLARLEYDWLRLRNPATGQIPKDMAQREMAFAHRLAQQTTGYSVSANWAARGPYNIGGRTRALAFDITNEEIVLAGGVTSGMFKSTDGGQSWVKTTAPNQLHSVTTIVQNKAPGHEHIWYYGTGDRSPGGIFTSASGFAANAYYRGDGIFKSTDGGTTWAQLPSTISATPEETDAFDFVWDIVTFGEDGVMAATSSGVFRSLDGGDTWTHVLNVGDSETYPSTEIGVTGDETFYATIGGNGVDNGIYRSTDGERWENISPEGWREATVRTVLSIAPSNENVVYFFTQVADLQQELWKFEAGVGWTDLTGNLPFNAQMATFGGVMLMISVKPNDADTFFLGAINLFRSTDGGETFEEISGTGPNFHVDQHVIAYAPSDPNTMIVGNDGGLYKTNNNLAATSNLSIEWEPLNNGYLTTQFYTVAIDRDTPGSEAIIGGTQDNGIVYTASSDPVAPWQFLHGGDGAFAAITNGGETAYYATAATFGVYRYTFQNGNQARTEVTPVDGRLGLWLAPFQLDPHDPNVMFLPSQRTLWRNADLSAIPDQVSGGPTDINWEPLEHVKEHFIHAMGMSEAEPRRLYYSGSFDGADAAERLFYLDNPHEGQPEPVDITGENFPFFPFTPFIGCIAVDPRDANKVIVVFPSYEQLSIFASEDGGQNWSPVSGNLEENPDGSGSGPSVRWVSILYVQDQPVYLAGTSVGLFSARALEGMNTTWVPEAALTIGNVVIDMIDMRQSDGFVAVATHGNGVYTTYITEVPTHTTEPETTPDAFALSSAYPNPFTWTTTLQYLLPNAGQVTAEVYNIQGQKVQTLFQGRRPAGRQTLRWEANGIANGTYFIQVQFENTSKVQQIVLQN